MGKWRHHLWLHLIVFIFGTTGVFGKLIDLDAALLVWYRVAIATAAIGMFLVFSRITYAADQKTTIAALLTGAIVALHWYTFFEGIKESTVSVALACFSSTALFTSLIEPIYFKRKIRLYEVLLGLAIIGGLSIIFTVEFKYVYGIVLSIISAALASWFTVINGKLVKKMDAHVISFYEMLSACMIVSIYLAMRADDITKWFPQGMEITWVLILGLICTAFAFLMAVVVMKKLSPYTVSISINLEPIYAIILAVIIWPDSEKMSPGFYVGTVIIIGAIFANAVLAKRLASPASEDE